MPYITSHEQRADQPGPGGHGDAIDLARGGARVRQRPVHHRTDGADVGPAGQLGHDAAEDAVNVLREDDQPAERGRAPSVRSTAAEVSSQEVSIPRIHSATARSAEGGHAVGLGTGCYPGGASTRRRHPTRLGRIRPGHHDEQAVGHEGGEAT